MHKDILLVTPPLPPAKPFTGYRSWLAKSKFVRDCWAEVRTEELAQMESERTSVEYGLCEFLTQHFLNLESEWDHGVGVSEIPYGITSNGMDRLESNHMFKNASLDSEAYFNGEIAKTEYLETYGFLPNALFEQKLDYLRSVSPNELIAFDSSTYYEFDGGWGLIVASQQGLPSIACLGISNDPIDPYLSTMHPRIGATKPIWDRNLLSGNDG